MMTIMVMMVMKVIRRRKKWRRRENTSMDQVICQALDIVDI